MLIARFYQDKFIWAVDDAEEETRRSFGDKELILLVLYNILHIR